MAKDSYVHGTYPSTTLLSFAEGISDIILLVA